MEEIILGLNRDMNVMWHQRRSTSARMYDVAAIDRWTTVETNTLKRYVRHPCRGDGSQPSAIGAYGGEVGQPIDIPQFLTGTVMTPEHVSVGACFGKQLVR